MAITYCPNGNMIGLSTDRPATPGTIPGGSFFEETDTQDIWFAQNSTTWVLAAAGVGGIGRRLLDARVATTANVTIASPGATIDGKAMNAGDVFLAAFQTAGAENGLYTWNGAAVPATRVAGYDNGTEVHGGDLVSINTGDAFQGDVFVLALDGAATVGTTSLPFQSLRLSTSTTDGSGGAGGNVTISTISGRAAVASGATAVTVTSPFCLATSIVMLTPLLIDANVAKYQVVPGAGSFVVTVNAATAAKWPFMFTILRA